MTGFDNYGGILWCKKHFERDCKECKEFYATDNNNHKPSVRTRNVEVRAAEVHKIIRFLNFGRHTIKVINFCPKCWMPNLIGSQKTDTLICDTCDAIHQHPTKELMQLDVDSYIELIKDLPLLNRGKIILSLQEKQKHENDPPVTYNDLTEEELHKYDELCGNLS